MAFQLVPSADHCHTPCVSVAALPLIATPAKVLALLPLATSSLLSSKTAPNKAFTVSPVAVVLSSAMAVNLAAPPVSGASLTANTLILLVVELDNLPLSSLTVMSNTRVPLKLVSSW